MSADTIILEADDLSFTTLAAGPADGELALLLHGFPDDPSTFGHLQADLAAAGFRVLVPTMRGYEPSSQPGDSDYSLTTLAADVVGWLDHLGVERAHVVGHDWGAAVAYVVAAHHPERCHSVTTLAIPPLTRIPTAVRRVPKQLLLSWYMTFFQLRGIAERSLRARSWALLRWFWPRWSPGQPAPDGLVAVFERPGVLGAALAYYRQNATPPLLLGLRTNEAMEPRPFGVPLLIIHGDDDGCMDHRLFDHAIHPDDFPHKVHRVELAGAGHFLHLDDPQRVGAIVRSWLADPGASPEQAG